MMIEGADSADRPTQETAEIEVTPEMIEAGVRELVSYDMTGDYDGQEVVSAVLAAAFAIRSDRGKRMLESPPTPHKPKPQPRPAKKPKPAK